MSQKNPEIENKMQNLFKKKRRKINDFDFFKSFIGGGTAGVISKTVVAPIQRVKIIYQVIKIKLS